jgi:hypothetical protein
MPDTEPANDLDVADILKVAGLSVLYALVTLASLFFLVLANQDDLEYRLGQGTWGPCRDAYRKAKPEAAA